jgi:hypothetical protein
MGGYRGHHLSYRSPLPSVLRQIAAGTSHNLALLGDGTAVSFGIGERGQQPPHHRLIPSDSPSLYIFMIYVSFHERYCKAKPKYI